jgi:hypothetical protein
MNYIIVLQEHSVSFENLYTEFECKGYAEIEFGNSIKIKIDRDFKILAAVNGWGNSCIDELRGEKLLIGKLEEKILL